MDRFVRANRWKSDRTIDIVASGDIGGTLDSLKIAVRAKAIGKGRSTIDPAKALEYSQGEGTRRIAAALDAAVARR